MQYKGHHPNVVDTVKKILFWTLTRLCIHYFISSRKSATHSQKKTKNNQVGWNMDWKQRFDKGQIECCLTLIKASVNIIRQGTKLGGKARVFIVLKAINEHDMLNERFSWCVKIRAHAVTWYDIFLQLKEKG